MSSGSSTRRQASAAFALRSAKPRYSSEQWLLPIAISTRAGAVLFVCLGNICRSPTAEGVFRAALEQVGMADRSLADHPRALAIGTSGRRPTGARSRAAQRRGYDLTKLRARQVDAARLRAIRLDPRNGPRHTARARSVAAGRITRATSDSSSMSAAGTRGARGSRPLLRWSRRVRTRARSRRDGERQTGRAAPTAITVRTVRCGANGACASCAVIATGRRRARGPPSRKHGSRNVSLRAVADPCASRPFAAAPRRSPTSADARDAGRPGAAIPLRASALA